MYKKMLTGGLTQDSVINGYQVVNELGSLFRILLQTRTLVILMLYCWRSFYDIKNIDMRAEMYTILQPLRRL